MSSEQLRLRNRAMALMTKRKYDKALLIYQRLETLDPNDPRWPHRAGDACRKLGNKARAIGNYSRAAMLYTGQGFTLKAIGLCKVILTLDPNHQQTQENLAQLVADKQRDWKARSETSLPAATGQSGAAGSASPPPPPALVSAQEIELTLEEEDDDVPLLGEHEAELLEASVLITLDDSPPPARSATPRHAAAPKPSSQPLPSLVPGPSAPEAAPRAYSDWHRSFDEVRQTSEGLPAVRMPVDPREAHPEIEIVLEEDEGLAKLDLRQIYATETAATRLQLFEVPLHAPGSTSPSAGHELPDTPVRLPPVPLFSWLDPRALRQLIERLEVRTYRSGETVIEQGSEAESLYVILEGKLAVCQGSDPPQVINHLREGAFFGEVALLTGGRRTASIIAETHAAVFVLSRAIVNEMIRQEPRVLTVMLRFLRDRLIHSQIERFSLQHIFVDEERTRLANCFRLFQAEPDTTLMRRGAPLDALFLLLQGDVSAGDLGKSRDQTLQLEQGDFFGVHALVAGREAPATVISNSRAWLLAIDRHTLAYVAGGYPKLLIYLAELAHARRRLPGLPEHNFHLL